MNFAVKRAMPMPGHEESPGGRYPTKKVFPAPGKGEAQAAKHRGRGGLVTDRILLLGSSTTRVEGNLPVAQRSMGPDVDEDHFASCFTAQEKGLLRGLACIAHGRRATEVTEPTENGTYGRYQSRLRTQSALCHLGRLYSLGDLGVLCGCCVSLLASKSSLREMRVDEVENCPGHQVVLRRSEQENR
jgi:hypothetical protein